MSSTIEALRKIAEKLYSDLAKEKIPSLELPSRTKSNIVFDEGYGVWKYGKQRVTRSAVSLSGAYMLLRTVYTADFIRQMIEQKKTSTLREMYYISEGWGPAKFDSQDDTGYGIPYNVEREKLRFVKTNADKVIAVETGGMFDRLVENRFDEKSNSILVHLKGQPARSTRRFIKRMNEELSLPVIVFTDGDPWSYRIYASVAYGAIKTAHISEYLATPSAQFLGITPSDILNYELPSDELNKEDISALQSELTDPRFQDNFWKNEIEIQLEIRKKAEQQALAKYGLDYVTDTYLPEKLAEMGYEV